MPAPVYVVGDDGKVIPVKLSDITAKAPVNTTQITTWVLIALNIIQAATLIYLAVR